MQHNFVFQLIFYPFQDKIRKLRIHNHENSLRMLPNMDVNLSLVQIQLLKIVYGCFPTWMSIYCLFNPRIREIVYGCFPTWMLIYHLFRFNF